MKPIHIPILILSILAASFSSSGCSKASARVTPLNPSELPATMHKAFVQSSKQTKELAATYVSAFQGQDPARAFLELQKLRNQQNLNPQQQSVLARAMMTTFKQLRTAADSGNQAAQSVMNHYLSSR